MTKTIITNGYVIDPLSDQEGVMDVVIEDGIVTSLGSSAGELSGSDVVDAEGKFVVPGFVDLQINPGKTVEYIADLLPLRGITTGVFMPCSLAGGETVLDHYHGGEGFIEACNGRGCNIVPSLPVTPPDATGHNAYEQLRMPLEKIEASILKALSTGYSAIGEVVLPLRGTAHVQSDLSVELLDALLDVTTKLDLPVQVHTGLGIEGIRGAIEVAKGRPFHLCHVGSTCAGDSIHRVMILLEDNPNVTADTHFSEIAGSTSGKSKLVSKYLEEGKVVKVDPVDLETRYITDMSSIEAPFYYGKENLFTNNLICVLSEEVDAIECDELGDGVRSSIMLKNCMRIVNSVIIRDQRISLLKKLVAKLTINPARILGISRGTISEGSAADVVVLDLENEDVSHVWINGNHVVNDGLFCGNRPGRIVKPENIRKIESGN